MSEVAFNVYSTTSAHITTLPVSDGNLIFVTDLKKIYFDIHGNRLSYDTVLTFRNDEERLQFASPLEGFYFVEDTHVFWRYSGGWIQISSENIEPIFFGDYNDFPSVGKSNTLYIANNATYRWNNFEKCYQMVANKTIWEQFY